MTRLFKWIGYLLGGVMVLCIAAIAYIYLLTDTKLNRVYIFPVSEVPVPSDTASIARGQHLVTTVGFCSDCHGADLGGNYFDEGPLIGALPVPNLTGGKGGISDEYTNQDWVRAIRHGVGRNGKTLMDMPSQVYNRFSDQDLGAIIAFIKTLPPIDRQPPPKRIGPVLRFYLLAMPRLLPAEHIDHNASRQPAPVPGPTAAYGEYLAMACVICHEEDLGGGTQPGAGLNITPGGDLGNWSEADFMRAMRSGVVPSGRALDPNMMPWHRIGLMTNDELHALWLYLHSLPPIKNPPARATATP